jgi:hypothetical protein
MSAIFFVIRGVLWLVAYFWVLGLIPLVAFLGLSPAGAKYDRRKDVVGACVAIAWIFAGYALYRWIIPTPVNPFFRH